MTILTEKAIVTKRNKDGTYDEVGMNNRAIFHGSIQKIRKDAKAYAKGPHRIEYFHDHNFYGSPHKVEHFEEDTLIERNRRLRRKGFLRNHSKMLDDDGNLVANEHTKADGNIKGKKVQESRTGTLLKRMKIVRAVDGDNYGLRKSWNGQQDSRAGMIQRKIAGEYLNNRKQKKLTLEDTLTELSKGTLKSYITKAMDDSNKHYDASTDAFFRSLSGNKEDRNKQLALSKFHSRMEYRRNKGIKRATDKFLSKEDVEYAVSQLTEEQTYDLFLDIIYEHSVEDAEKFLTELSKKTLQSYRSKSGNVQQKLAGKANRNSEESKTIRKRAKGFALATKKLKQFKEDVEPLTELSKKTLASYLNKSKADFSNLVKADNKALTRRMRINPNKPGAAEKTAKEAKIKNDLRRKMGNRATYAVKASKKLRAESVEPLTELSRKTLDSYLGKTVKYQGGVYDRDVDLKVAKRREAGRVKAYNRKNGVMNDNTKPRYHNGFSRLKKYRAD